MWLEVDRSSHSNNNLRIIAKYFLKTVRCIGGTPRIVRGDCGTENCYVEAMQRFLREGQGGVFQGDKSFIYGRSVSNQRIEAWWNMLRKLNTDFWINYFKDMREIQLYNDNDIFQGALKWYYDQKIISFFLQILKACFLNT